MAEVVRKERCPKCEKEGRDSSGNNMAVYDDGGMYCWAGHGLIKKGNSGDDSFDVEDSWEIMGAEFNDEIHAELKAATTYNTKGWRGIRKETARYFGVLHEYNDDGELFRQYYPATTGYELTGYKYRTIPKNFGSLGTTGKNCDLFGQFRFKQATGRYVLVTAGEVDQLSAYQMLRDSQIERGNEDYDPIPVVSPTVGETGGIKQLAAQFEWFDRFDRIVLCFDPDDAGRKATEDAVKILPRGKVYTMSLVENNDTNKYLTDGREKAWVAAFYNAKKYVPGGVTSSMELEEKMLEYISTPRLTLPPFMHKAQKMLCGGFPTDCIVNILAASGVGKSTIVDSCILHWIFQPDYRVGIVSLEASEGEYGVNLSSAFCGFKINLIEDTQERIAYLQKPENVEKRKVLWQDENGDPRFYLVDSDIDTLQSKVEYLIVSLGCKVIVLDPLQDIFDAMDEDQQAKFMKWQKDTRKRYKMIFININHARKAGQGQKAGSRGASLSEEDMHGSSTIFKSGAINIILQRDKEAEEEIERNTTHAKITKARGVGNTGPCGEYYYDNPTHKLWDKQDWLRAQGADY